MKSIWSNAEELILDHVKHHATYPAGTREISIEEHLDTAESELRYLREDLSRVIDENKRLREEMLPKIKLIHFQTSNDGSEQAS
jgi:Cys-tRNA synthase (O-phospho-L-seryl-tRNA:Cys-tRNA synthase)